MLSSIAKAPKARRTLLFASAMHVWSDLFFAIPIPLLILIQEDMGLSYTEVGLLRSVFGGASAVLQIPAGVLAETFGEFWLLLLGNVWVGVGLIAMALSPVFIVLLVSCFLGGLGGGMQHPLASSMVSRAYDDRGRSTAVGTVNFAGDLGKIAAPVIVAAAIALSYGWRSTLWLVGAAGIAFTLLTTLTRRSVDAGRPAGQPEGDAVEAGGAVNLRPFIALSFVGFVDSTTRGAALVFLPFVMDDKGMQTSTITAMLALLFVGGAAGKYVCGLLGERYSAVSLIWVTKGVTALLLALALAAPPIAMAPLMIVLGIGLNGTSSVLYATVADVIPVRRRARLYGFYYTTNEGGAVISPICYGLVADIFSLSAAVGLMVAVTAAILPASLSLGGHRASSSAR